VILEPALERIVAWHKQHGRKVVDLLQPGLTAQAITAATAALPLHDDVVQFYLWRNGTRISQEYVLNDHYFIPGYYLLSLKDALDAYHSLISNTDWQNGWFPILTSGGGDYYGVNFVQQGKVIHYVRDYPDYQMKYLSLSTMMQTAAECYESGAYSLDDRGFFEVNADAERLIARRLNPGLDYWQMD
jgi:cell wall assembly regulator SMI1